MTKMFTYQGKTMTTWNAFTGCRFDCTYCWAKGLATNRLKTTYPNGFVPEFHPDRLKKRFKPDEFVFVSSMGDISFSQREDRTKIFEVVEAHPQTKFLFCTKNPGIYHKYPEMDNVYYGATIETNRTITKQFSKAPEPLLRYGIMASLEGVKKFLSIEPVMDFDLLEFSTWIYEIAPRIIEIGADNYSHGLPEPSGEKVKKLIEVLTLHGVTVIQKRGLERLLK